MSLNSSDILQEVIYFSLLSLNNIFSQILKKECRRFKPFFRISFSISFVFQWQFHAWRLNCRYSRQIQPITSKKRLRRRLETGFLKKVKTFQMYDRACVFVCLTIFTLIV